MFCVCLVSYVFEWVDFEGFVLYLVVSWTLPVKIFIYDIGFEWWLGEIENFSISHIRINY